jgi:UDP-3-O-[3-hydroxymyristoyl] glucosamine N-acyltransferase
MSVRFEVLVEAIRGHWINAAGGFAPEQPLKRVATLKSSTPETVAFFLSKEYTDDLKRAAPGVLVIPKKLTATVRELRPDLFEKAVIIESDQAYVAMADVSALFHKAEVDARAAIRETFVHSTAVIDPSVRLGQGIRVGPYVVVGANTVIQDRVVLDAHVVVGEACVIAEGVHLYPHVVLYSKVHLGARAIIHSGSVIGADGFGYAQRRGDQGQVLEHVKIHHHGGVVIGADVEIGSNVCIDQGTLEPTQIGEGTKIDNDVHIAHNSIVGRYVILCGQVGLAGGSELGDFVVMGGQAGVGLRSKVGEGSEVGANTQINRDVPPHSKVLGIPARPYGDYWRMHAILNRMIRGSHRKKEGS